MLDLAFLSLSPHPNLRAWLDALAFGAAFCVVPFLGCIRISLFSAPQATPLHAEM